MSETTDTSAIDEKNEEANNPKSDDVIKNTFNFILLLFVLLIVVCLFFTSGGLILYVCKLAQSNILPTDKNSMPYTDIKPSIEKIQSDIFTTTIKDDKTGKTETLSKKISFPYDEYNSSNYVLDMFRNYKNKSNSNFLVNYIISLIEPLIQLNYSIINKLSNMLNDRSDTFIILVGPILVSIVSMFTLLIDQLYLLYLWFANMTWFFKTNTNDSGTGKPNWEPVTITSPFYFWIGLLFVFMFCILFIFSLPVLSIFAAFAIAWAGFSCFFYKANLNGKMVNALDIIQNEFKYFKIPFIWTFSILLIISAFSRLGPLFGFLSIVSLMLIKYNIIPLDLFAPLPKDIFIKDGFTSLVKNVHQAKRSSNFTEPTKSKHGFLYNLLIGQKGGITNDLKNLSKNK
jgi:hypothetical protein